MLGFKVSSWPTAAVLIAGLAAVVLVALFAPEHSIEALWGGGGLLVGAILRQPVERSRGGGVPPLSALLLLAVFAAGCGGTSARDRLLDVARKVRDGGCHGARIGCRIADRVCAATGGPDVLGDDELGAVVDEELAAE